VELRGKTRSGRGLVESELLVRGGKEKKKNVNIALRKTSKQGNEVQKGK